MHNTFHLKLSPTLLVFFFLLGVLGIALFAISSQYDIRQQAAVMNSRNESSPPRGVEGDLWADIILGKRDFTEISAREIVDYKLNIPGGVVVDRRAEGDFMYVWDSGNNRVIGYYLKDCPNPKVEKCHAKIVLGQSSGFDQGTCNGDSSGVTYPTKMPARADTLCGTDEFTQTTLEYKSFAGMAVDAQHNLYVTDVNNNRILRFNDPVMSDTTADRIWGQNNFSDNYCNMKNDLPTAASLCIFTEKYDRATPGSDLVIDHQGYMWVVDAGNNRILRYPPSPDQNTAFERTPDLVLGQPNFTTRSYGSRLYELNVPRAIAVSLDGKKVFVGDSDNKRILVYTAPFSNGMSGSVFSPSTNFALVNSLRMDPLGRGLWVFAELKETTGQIKRIVGIIDLATAQFKHQLTVGLAGGGSIAIDTNDNLYFSSYWSHSVLKVKYNGQ